MTAVAETEVMRKADAEQARVGGRPGKCVCESTSLCGDQPTPSPFDCLDIVDAGSADQQPLFEVRLQGAASRGW